MGILEALEDFSVLWWDSGDIRNFRASEGFRVLQRASEGFRGPQSALDASEGFRGFRGL